jgi:hypothetical protein
VERLVGTAAPGLVCIDCGGAPPIVLVGARGGGINLEPSPFFLFPTENTYFGPIFVPKTAESAGPLRLRLTQAHASDLAVAYILELKLR